MCTWWPRDRVRGIGASNSEVMMMSGSWIVLVGIRARRKQQACMVGVWTWKYVINKGDVRILMQIVELVKVSSLWSVRREETTKKHWKEVGINSFKGGQFLLNDAWPLYEFSWLPLESKRVVCGKDYTYSPCGIVYEGKTTRNHHCCLLWLVCRFVEGQNITKTCLEGFERLWHQV